MKRINYSAWVGAATLALALLGGVYEFAANQGQLTEQVVNMRSDIAQMKSELYRITDHVPQAVLDSLSHHSVRIAQLERMEFRQGRPE